MSFTISCHAEEELKRRGIPRGLLEETLAAPQQIVPAHGGKSAYQSQFDFDGKTYLLRVIVSTEVCPASVVTVYRTSRVQKYWRVP